VLDDLNSSLPVTKRIATDTASRPSLAGCTCNWAIAQLISGEGGWNKTLTGDITQQHIDAEAMWWWLISPFIIFAILSMCQSIHVAVNTWLNCSFFTFIFYKAYKATNLQFQVQIFLFHNFNKGTRKLCYRKDDRAMRPIRGYPEKFRDSWLRPRLLFPTFSWTFVRIDPMNVPTKFEVRSLTRSWDNRGYPKNLGSPWIRPRSLFSKIFNRLLFGLALYMYPSNLKSVALPVPKIRGGS